MDNNKIQEEVSIIIQQAGAVDIQSQEQLIQFVKVAIAASDRLIIHAATLYDQSASHQASLGELSKNIEGLRESTENLAQVSGQTWNKARRATRISLITIAFLLLLLSGFFWNHVPETYKIVAISGAAGWLLPKLVGWGWDEFRS